MKEINSESKFIWSFLLGILLTPVTLVQIIFKKKQIKDLFKPFNNLIKFIFEPKFTITIIIINILVFFLSMFFSKNLFNSLMNYPNDLFSLRFYSLFTSGFLHANLSHLFGNMLGIFIFGRVVEKELGFSKTMFIYFGALIISGVFQSLVNLFFLGANIPSLGASGALMGLISTAILLNPFYFSYELIFPLPIMVIGWLAIYADIIGVLNPSQDGIGHFAHIGGFISIGILMFLISKDKSKLKKGFLINIASLLIVILGYFLFF